jgi:hypothetical protein
MTRFWTSECDNGRTEPQIKNVFRGFSPKREMCPLGMSCLFGWGKNQTRGAQQGGHACNPGTREAEAGGS